MQSLPAVQHGRILYVDEVLSQAAQLHGAAVRVLGQCALPAPRAPRRVRSRAPCLQPDNVRRGERRGGHRAPRLPAGGGHLAGVARGGLRGACGGGACPPGPACRAGALTRRGAQPSALLQFIGELDSRDGAGEARARPLLRARVARRVDGLDLALYEQALAVRRRVFEAQGQGAQQ